MLLKMDIGIIRRKINIVILLSLSMFSCKIPQNNVERADNFSKCKLHEQQFDIDLTGYKEFNSELTDFFNTTSNEYDILKIFMRGGNHQDSYLKRWFINEKQKWMRVDQKDTEKARLVSGISPEGIDDLLGTISTGSFMQTCNYSSNNDSYIYLIKRLDKIKFQYFTSSADYNSLGDSDKDKVYNAIRVFLALEE